jgi:hypothetical protein
MQEFGSTRFEISNMWYVVMRFKDFEKPYQRQGRLRSMWDELSCYFWGRCYKSIYT